MMRQALFLDRDGTLVEHRPYLHRPEDVTLIPGTAQALRLSRESGWLLFLFTNQSGVGRGYFSLDAVHRVHARLLELLGLGTDLFTEICVAPEHPGEASAYRKPSPRFILETVARHQLEPGACWMVGDSRSDWEAGLAAGIQVAAVRSNLTTPEVTAAALRLDVTMYPTLAAFVENKLCSSGS